MNTKSTVAVLGPALLLAGFTLIVDMAALMPAQLHAFTIALIASLLTLVILAFKPRPAAARSAKSTAANNVKKETGSVKWFNASKGFGFITRANGEEIFVHFRSVVGQRSLRDGQRVEFAVTNGSKGLQAEEVVALK